MTNAMPGLRVGTCVSAKPVAMPGHGRVHFQTLTLVRPKFMFTHLKNLFVALSLACILAACGGGGGSGSGGTGAAAVVSAAPTHLAAMGADSAVTLSWDASANATAYAVKRSTTAGGPYTQLGTVAGVSYVDAGRVNGTTYYYVVSAISAGGESSNSGEVTARPLAALPLAPAGFSAIATDAQVALSWNQAASASGYSVKRASNSGGPYTQIATPSGTTYLDSGLQNGATYYYVVTALNSAGESAASSESAATPAKASNTGVVIPIAPSGLLATPADGQVALNWAAAAGASSYKLKRATTTGGPYAQVALLTATTYTDGGRINGTKYYYVVSASNSAGESVNSAEVAATPAATGGVSVPAAPTGVAAIAGDSQVALNWGAVGSANSYRLKRATTSGGPYTQITLLTGTSYTDTGRANGTKYYYVVSALNVIGEGANSGEVSATPAPATPVASAPAVPTGLAAAAADSQVALSWNVVATASSYKLKRATTAGGPYTQVVAQAGTSYTDTGRSNGTTYYYAVAAVNASGESANSAAIAATPLASTPVAGLPVLPANDPTKNYIGMNVWFLSDWDGSFAFVDVMKQARPWQDGANWNNPVAGIDAYGWPTADASTVTLTGAPAQINGTYKLIFNGQATVSLMWAPGSVSNQVYNAANNTTTADVTYAVAASGSVGLIFRNTKRTATSATNTGFTNVRLYRPGYPSDGSKVFTTPFLAGLGKASAVRMMDWTYTNANLVQHWGDRRTPQHMFKAGLPYTGPGGATWSTSQTGVAIEHEIQLCNALHADCWINIPVVADDDYVRKLALALRYGSDGVNPYSTPQTNPAYPPLDPGLRVYLEYANEIWNSAGGFDCFGVIQDIVGSLPANHPVLNPAESSIWFKMWRYPAYRMALISDIFRNVYGDASMMNRVRPVLMTQQGNGQTTLEQGLNWLEAYGARQSPARTVSSYLYAAGGSGYYGVNSTPANTADTNAFFAAGNYPATQNVKGFGVDAVWSANFGLKHIAYEGGPSLDNFPDANARAINADARMQDMVVKTHDAWSAQGGDLLMYYTLVGPSSWEFTPDIATIQTPKFKALTQLQSQARAPVTLGGALPGTLVATDLSDYRIRTGYDYATTCDALPCLGGNDPGEWVALPAHVSTAFTGNLVVNGIAYTATTLNVWINGVKKGQVTLPAGNHLATSTVLNTAIPAGLAVIRLEVVSGGINLRSISVN